MPQVRVYNFGYDPGTGIGELLHTTTVRHAFGMIRREVANPVELTMVDQRIVPLALELTRELSGAWVEGAGRRSVGFSYRAVHERAKVRDDGAGFRFQHVCVTQNCRNHRFSVPFWNHLKIQRTCPQPVSGGVTISRKPRNTAAECLTKSESPHNFRRFRCVQNIQMLRR